MTDLNLELLKQFINSDSSTPISPTTLKLAIASPKTPLYVLYILAALSSSFSKLDPTNLLLQSISTSKTPEDLIPVALSLRFLANPNTYATVPTIGNIHILAYTYIELYNHVESDILNAIIIMLLLYGSDPLSKVFYQSSNQTTLQWIQTRYPTIIPRLIGSSSIQTNQIEPFFRTAIGTLIDDTNIIDKIPIITDTLRVHSQKVFTNYLSIFPSTDYSIFLDQALHFYNAGAYLYLVEHGIIPKYWQIYNLLIQLQENKEDPLVKRQLLSMLDQAISHGAEFDAYQLEFLKSIDAAAAAKVEKLYAVPFWKKYCKITDAIIKSVPSRLLNFAVALNMDPKLSLFEICKRLEKYSEADPEKLTLSGQTQQKYLLAGLVGNLNDFMEGPPSIVCANSTSIEDLNKMDWTAYRDSDGQVWCFTRPIFEELLSTKVNPHTKDSLPSIVLTDISGKMVYLESFGLLETRPKISEAVKMLTEADKMEKNDNSWNNFVNKAALTGLTGKDLKKLTPIQLDAIAKQFNFPLRLKELEPVPAQVEFARYVEYRYGGEGEKYIELFRYIISKNSF